MADIKNTLGTNLVSHWTVDESSAGSSPVTRNDSHTSNNHLSDTNNVASTTGLRSNALTINPASSQYLSIADASQTGLDISTAGTFSAWVNFTSAPGGSTQIVMSKMGPSGSRSYALGFREYSSQQHALFQTSSDGTNATNTNYDINVSISNSTWYHCVWTFNAGTMEFFLNGTSQGSTSGNTSWFNSSNKFVIGGVPDDGGLYLNGKIDEVTVWSRVLSSGEITTLYNSGSPLAYDSGGTTAHRLSLLGVGT